jgi:hypothetical protein
MRTLVLENRHLRLVSLLDKGSDIIELVYKPLDIDLMFHAPTGYRKPGTMVGTCKRSEGEFMEYYGGGWQDILSFAGRQRADQAQIRRVGHARRDPTPSLGCSNRERLPL